jgi:hypothetical protein
MHLNERAGCWLGNHLIADHPEIKAHLATRVADSKITMIPYGADRIDNPDSGVLAQYGLQPGGYAMVIARPRLRTPSWRLSPPSRASRAG